MFSFFKSRNSSSKSSSSQKTTNALAFNTCSSRSRSSTVAKRRNAVSGLMRCTGGERSRSCTPERNARISCKLPIDKINDNDLLLSKLAMSVNKNNGYLISKQLNYNNKYSNNNINNNNNNINGIMNADICNNLCGVSENSMQGNQSVISDIGTYQDKGINFDNNNFEKRRPSSPDLLDCHSKTGSISALGKSKNLKKRFFLRDKKKKTQNISKKGSSTKLNLIENKTYSSKNNLDSKLIESFSIKDGHCENFSDSSLQISNKTPNVNQKRAIEILSNLLDNKYEDNLINFLNEKMFNESNKVEIIDQLENSLPFPKSNLLKEQSNKHKINPPLNNNDTNEKNSCNFLNNLENLNSKYLVSNGIKISENTSNNCISINNKKLECPQKYNICYSANNNNNTNIDQTIETINSVKNSSNKNFEAIYEELVHSEFSPIHKSNPDFTDNKHTINSANYIISYKPNVSTQTENIEAEERDFENCSTNANISSNCSSKVNHHICYVEHYNNYLNNYKNFRRPCIKTNLNPQNYLGYPSNRSINNHYYYQLENYPNKNAYSLEKLLKLDRKRNSVVIDNANDRSFEKERDLKQTNYDKLVRNFNSSNYLNYDFFNTTNNSNVRLGCCSPTNKRKLPLNTSISNKSFEEIQYNKWIFNQLIKPNYNNNMQNHSRFADDYNYDKKIRNFENNKNNNNSNIKNVRNYYNCDYSIENENIIEDIKTKCIHKQRSEDNRYSFYNKTNTGLEQLEQLVNNFENSLNFNESDQSYLQYSNQMACDCSLRNKFSKTNLTRKYSENIVSNISEFKNSNNDETHFRQCQMYEYNYNRDKINNLKHLDTLNSTDSSLETFPIRSINRQVSSSLPVTPKNNFVKLQDNKLRTSNRINIHNELQKPNFSLNLKENVNLIRTFYLNQYIGTKWLTSLVIVENNFFAVTDKNNAYLFNPLGEFVNSIGGKNHSQYALCEPIAMTTLGYKKNCLIFSDRADQNIKIFNIEDIFLYVINDPRFTNITGIASNFYGDIFVACADRGCVLVARNNEVQIIDSSMVGHANTKGNPGQEFIFQYSSLFSLIENSEVENILIKSENDFKKFSNFSDTTTNFNLLNKPFATIPTCLRKSEPINIEDYKINNDKTGINLSDDILRNNSGSGVKDSNVLNNYTSFSATLPISPKSKLRSTHFKKKPLYFSHPYSLCYNQSNGQIIVGDDEKHLVIAFNDNLIRNKISNNLDNTTSNLLAWRFVPLEGKGENFLPSSICVDTIGRVFLANSHDKKIYLLESNGKFIKTLLSEKNGLTGNPSAIVVDETGLIYVSDEQSTIKIFKLV